MKSADRIKQIYMYKGWAFLKEAHGSVEKHYCMPDNSSGFWQKCTKEEYEQAKYYGLPARNKVTQRNKKKEVAL